MLRYYYELEALITQHRGTMKEIIDTILSEDGKLICHTHWREFRDVEKEWNGYNGASETKEIKLFNKVYDKYDTEHQFGLQIKRG